MSATGFRLGYSTVADAIAALGSGSLASWSIAGARIYAVDGVAGSDANSGFADSASQTAGAIAAATVVAGGRAKKTLAGLAAIFPRVGAGRFVQIVIASGTYAEALVFLQGVEGYTELCVNATSTNASAGSVAFAGDANTNTFCGAITVPGLNAPGYNPVAVFSTTIVKMVQVGGGAPALPAEPAAPLGWRVRFDVATTTAALRGICKAIVKVSGTDTVQVDSALPAVPVGTDVFYIEKAGVLVNASTLSISGNQRFSMGGVDVGGQLRLIGDTPSVLGLCACTSFVADLPAGVQANRIYRTVIANVAAGGGLRIATTTAALFFGGVRFEAGDAIFVGHAEFLNPPQLGLNGPLFFGAGLTIQGGGMGAQAADITDQLGSSSAAAPLRFVGASTDTASIFIRGARLRTAFIDIQNAGARPAFALSGTCEIVIGSVMSGATGNTDVGLDLTAARNSTIALNATPTVTGTAGDVRLSDGTIATWAQCVAGIIDPAGNVIAGPATSPMRLSPIANGAVVIAAGGAVGPVGSGPGVIRWAKIPDGAGGFFLFPSFL